MSKEHTVKTPKASDYQNLFDTWQYDCKIWKERIDVAEKTTSEIAAIYMYENPHWETCTCFTCDRLRPFLTKEKQKVDALLAQRQEKEKV